MFGKIFFSYLIEWWSLQKFSSLIRFSTKIFKKWFWCTKMFQVFFFWNFFHKFFLLDTFIRFSASQRIIFTNFSVISNKMHFVKNHFSIISRFHNIPQEKAGFRTLKLFHKQKNFPNFLGAIFHLFLDSRRSTRILTIFTIVHRVL